MELFAWTLSLALGAVAPLAQSAAPLRTLPPSAIKTLTGCWSIKADPARWFFRPNGATGLDAFVEDTSWPGAHGLGAPHAVMFEPSTNTYAFAMPGRHHSLLILFTIQGSRLEARYYTRHNPRQGYYWTSNTAQLYRCPA